MNVPQLNDLGLDRYKDEYLGRVKEAAGVLLDNENWKQSGRRDQHAARLKGASTDVKRKMDDMTDRMVKKGRDTVGRSGD